MNHSFVRLTLRISQSSYSEKNVHVVLCVSAFVRRVENFAEHTEVLKSLLF